MADLLGFSAASVRFQYEIYLMDYMKIYPLITRNCPYIMRVRLMNGKGLSCRKTNRVTTHSEGRTMMWTMHTKLGTAYIGAVVLLTLAMTILG